MTLYLRILSYIKPYMHRLIFAMFLYYYGSSGEFIYSLDYQRYD